MSGVGASALALADLLEALPVHLADVRRDRQRTLREVEDATGVSLSTLNRIESGMPCTTTTAAKLLRWLA